jgi:preprotein translocase subunit SecG
MWIGIKEAGTSGDSQPYRSTLRRLMATILIVIHVMIAVAMIGVILLQRSEGGGLGIGGGGGMGGLMSGRGTHNLLTRSTAILAVCFMLTSIGLALLSINSGERRSIIDELPTEQQAPVEAPATEPSVPVRQ